MAKILCPLCGHCLGDTKNSFDGNLKCRWCKKTVGIRLRIATTNDYFKMKKENKHD